MANCDSMLGRWGDVAAGGERMRALADAMSSRRDVAMAQLHPAQAAEALGDLAAALRWHEHSLLTRRAMGNRRFEAIALRFLTGLHLQRDDLVQAMQCCSQSQTLHRDRDEPLEACMADAYMALCQARLGQFEGALSALSRTLDRLDSDLAGAPSTKPSPCAGSVSKCWTAWPMDVCQRCSTRCIPTCRCMSPRSPTPPTATA